MRETLGRSMGGSVRPAVRWSLVVVVAVLLVISAASFIGCGSDADPYAGTWLGPTLGPSPQADESRAQLTIEPASAGWWSIDGPGGVAPFYAAEINGELQTANGRNTFKRVGNGLEVTLYPGAPATTFTKQ